MNYLNANEYIVKSIYIVILTISTDIYIKVKIPQHDIFIETWTIFIYNNCSLIFSFILKCCIELPWLFVINQTLIQRNCKMPNTI